MSEKKSPVDWREWLGRFVPDPGAVSSKERWRAATEAAAATLIVVVLSNWLIPSPPFVLAAVGASAVLVFALPASPLAQPWPVVGSYVIGAAAGIMMGQAIPSVPLAAALGVGLATLGMLWLRCLHPPGGAVALIALMGNQGGAFGWPFLLLPTLANALMIVVAALVLNNLMGRHYPRRAQAPNLKPLMRLGLQHEDLERALEDFARPVAVSGEELDEILILAERHARGRSAKAGQAKR